MSEHPILFTGPMVRAILSGAKTQTRRPVTRLSSTVPRTQNTLALAMCGDKAPLDLHLDVPKPDDSSYQRVRPRVDVGDTLWVRETWGVWPHMAGFVRGAPFCYAATDAPPEPAWRWKPSIHMPRWASRITLRITGVRVERVQEISLVDCYAEGIERPAGPQLGSVVCETDNARQKFLTIWDSCYAARGLGCAANPWVWVVEFERT